MKKIILIVSVLILAINVQAKDKDLRVGIEAAYPPFSKTLPDGSYVGFDIDIANALCNELGRKCVLIKQNWDGLIPALMARKFDAIIASMSITAERKKKVAFTNKYYTAPARFISRKGTFNGVSNAKLKGKNIGVQRSTIMDKFVTDNYGSIVTVKRYKTQDEANLDLISGRVDLAFMEVVVGGDFLKTAEGGQFEFIGRSYSNPKWFGEGIGIAIRKQDKKLVRQLNKAIKTIRSNGVYQTIQSQYFAFDIYGD